MNQPRRLSTESEISSINSADFHKLMNVHMPELRDELDEQLDKDLTQEEYEDDLRDRIEQSWYKCSDLIAQIIEFTLGPNDILDVYVSTQRYPRPPMTLDELIATYHDNWIIQLNLRQQYYVLRGLKDCGFSTPDRRHCNRNNDSGNSKTGKDTANTETTQPLEDTIRFTISEFFRYSPLERSENKKRKYI